MHQTGRDRQTDRQTSGRVGGRAGGLSCGQAGRQAARQTVLYLLQKQTIYTVMNQSNRSLNIPPGNYRLLNFWKIFVHIPSSPYRKAVQMPPPPGKLPDCFFNISVASIMLLRLRMLTWFIRQHIFIYYRNKLFLNTIKYGTQLV